VPVAVTVGPANSQEEGSKTEEVGPLFPSACICWSDSTEIGSWPDATDESVDGVVIGRELVVERPSVAVVDVVDCSVVDAGCCDGDAPQAARLVAASRTTQTMGDRDRTVEDIERSCHGIEDPSGLAGNEGTSQRAGPDHRLRGTSEVGRVTGRRGFRIRGVATGVGLRASDSEASVRQHPVLYRRRRAFASGVDGERSRQLGGGGRRDPFLYPSDSGCYAAHLVK
jgi:hypothetical protein